MNSRHTVVESPLGQITLVAIDDALMGLYFPHHWYMPSMDTFGNRVEALDDAVFSAAAIQLDEYFRGDRTSFDLKTATRGDLFQEQVWALLKDIPSGETTTYGELAEELGNKSLAQQVGKAVGQNPLCIIVPCHRVVGKGGKLTGYAGGIPRKQFLLELEESEDARAARLLVDAGKLF
ncbi:methylated-DNA--[protein]-cysteine S-methyltransferase [Herbiconiux sp. 11R-BC]|uniref:methylated-DNA--[protein]-cysteine S-methyltransferase n=1 Tax=Herbiconiux sp. 11R-BC TaxID=3111637 RepID=UPI003BFEB8FF